MKLPKYFYFRVRVKVNHHGTEIEVEDASDADVVEVVRCKDCRFFDKHYVGFGYNVCHKLNQMMHENDYCSCGERRKE